MRSRKRDGSGNAKSVSFKYFLRLGVKSVKVCKKYFLGTFQISEKRLYNCITKDEVFGVIDGRGRKKPRNKLDDTGVIEHIKSFPSFQSHYTRKNPERKHLHPDLTIRKMYELYVKKCEDGNETPVKEKYYYHLFNTKFNLHFKPPLKDTCRTCDEMELKIKQSRTVKLKNPW